MCNTCNNGCGFGGCRNNNGCGNNGYDPLLAALTNLFAPLGCGCGNGNLVLVQNLGTVGTNGGFPVGNNNGCGCGNNNGGGWNGCGCGNTYDAYYVRQYALNSCCNN